jgi:uncharacterized membrane protein (DUF441 family)
MKKKSALKILVTAKTGRLDQIMPKLQESGMKIGSVLDTVGIVTGEIDPIQLNRLRKLPGITVEEDKAVQIPGPESPLQ